MSNTFIATISDGCVVIFICFTIALMFVLPLLLSIAAIMGPVALAAYLHSSWAYLIYIPEALTLAYFAGRAI